MRCGEKSASVRGASKALSDSPLDEMCCCLYYHTRVPVDTTDSTSEQEAMVCDVLGSVLCKLRVDLEEATLMERYQGSWYTNECVEYSSVCCWLMIYRQTKSLTGIHRLTPKV